MEGHEVQEEPEAVRNSIGFLTSDIKLDEQFDPDYMLISLEGSAMCRGKSWKNEKRSCLHISDPEFAHKPIKELSTGMKQKAAIAVRSEPRSSGDHF